VCSPSTARHIAVIRTNAGPLGSVGGATVVLVVVVVVVVVVLVDGSGSTVGESHRFGAPGVPSSPRSPNGVTDVHQLAGSLLSASSARSDADAPGRNGSGRSTSQATRSTQTRSASSRVISSSLLVSGKSVPYE
jgi:hypothetical protein